MTLYFNQGYSVDLTLFDFVEAFGRIHHRTLLNKLTLLGITGNLYHWIENFLLNRSMSLSIVGEKIRTRPFNGYAFQHQQMYPSLCHLEEKPIAAHFHYQQTINPTERKLQKPGSGHHTGHRPEHSLRTAAGKGPSALSLGRLGRVAERWRKQHILLWSDHN